MCLHVAFGKLFVGLSSGFVAVIDLKVSKVYRRGDCLKSSLRDVLARPGT